MSSNQWMGDSNWSSPTQSKSAELKLDGSSNQEITSVESLIDTLEKISVSNGGNLWFRGQSAFDWDLSPGFFRLSGKVSESTLLMRFKQTAAQLVSNIPKESFDWMFLMQHYGLPTRLLDWSESPLIALYFAVENKLSHDKDGSLWILDPTKLNTISRIQSKNEDHFIPSFEDEVLKNYTMESVRSGNQHIFLSPVAIIATRNNPRIQAQLGVFTVHHNSSETIEKGEGEKNHYIKIKIPAKRKEHIKKQLSMLGYSRFQIFPELSSISDVIKERML